MNNVPFLSTKLFQKRGHYSRGDIIQGGGDIIKGNTVLAINHAHSKAETTIQIVIWGRPLQIQHISYFRCNLPEAN